MPVVYLLLCARARFCCCIGVMRIFAISRYTHQSTPMHNDSHGVSARRRHTTQLYIFIYIHTNLQTQTAADILYSIFVIAQAIALFEYIRFILLLHFFPFAGCSVAAAVDSISFACLFVSYFSSIHTYIFLYFRLVRLREKLNRSEMAYTQLWAQV